MEAFKENDGTYTLKPFKHDCKECEWVGWISNSKLGNVYICQGKTVVIRYSDEPSDYWSSTIGNNPGSISNISGKEIDALKKREDYYKEEI